MSDVSRILQRLVSTIQSVVLTAEVFHFPPFSKKIDIVCSTITTAVVLQSEYLTKEDAFHHFHDDVSFWAAAKNKCTWSVWGQKQVRSGTKSNVYPASPAIGLERIVPDFGRM